MARTAQNGETAQLPDGLTIRKGGSGTIRVELMFMLPTAMRQELLDAALACGMGGSPEIRLQRFIGECVESVLAGRRLRAHGRLNGPYERKL